MPRGTKIFLTLYLLILAAFLAGKPLNSDAYYYWNWSYHLALSYYDGPPLIAYIIKLFTTLFGQHIYALCLFNLLTAAITAIITFRLGKQLFNSETGTFGMAIWLLTMTVVHTYFMHLTYVTALILFWATTFYFFVQLVEKRKRRYYYLTAISAGLMLLSHYKGILLLIVLFLLCIGEKRYRFALKTIHCYLAILLTLIIFSPVLIWNWQHDWISFKFQLHHGLANFHSSPWINIIHYFHDSISGSNIAFFALLYILAAHYREILRDYKLRLLLVPTLFIWGFFLVTGFFSLPLPFWNTMFNFSNAMFIAPFCVRGMRNRLLRLLFLIGLAAPTLATVILARIPAMTTFNTQPIPIAVNTIYIPSQRAKQMLQTLPAASYRNRLLFVSDSYTLGSYLATFLPGKRYQVFGTGPSANQYFYWWQQAKADIDNKQALYFSFTKVEDFPSLFNHCQLETRLHQHEKFILSPDYTWQIFVYSCELK